MSATGRCDECGRPMAAPHRVYKGHRYCGTCYAREFKPRACPRCGKTARLPRGKPEAVCRRCESDKPCARCGKTGYRPSKITPYGPVCGSCAHYFRDPRRCGLCGRLSTTLSKAPRLGIDVPICERCVTRDHATCPACHRHRLLREAPDGRRLCKRCLEEGEVPCPSCGNPMPAGRVDKCEACYWRGLLRKRVEIDRAAFSSKEMEAAFGEFGEWLMKEVGSPKAAITIHRYLPFFMEIEARWRKIPGYPRLLAHFGAERLRRVRLPMRWMKEARGVRPDPELREADSERRRIEALVASIPGGTVAAEALAAYHKRLMRRMEEGKTSIRSVRLALRPAVSLLRASDPAGKKLPDQADLDRYLRHSPGQKAAVSGFVNMLNRRYGTSLVRRHDKWRTGEIRRKILEAEILSMMREGGEGEDFKRRWLSVTLMYFHGLPRGVGKKVKEVEIEESPEGFTVTHKGLEYWVPKISFKHE